MENDRQKKLQIKHRTPLQNVNGLPSHKRTSRNTSILTSNSSSSSNSRFNLVKNAVSRKPILQKREKTRRENGEKCRNPIFTNGRISKLSSGPQKFHSKSKNSRQIGYGKRDLEVLETSTCSNLNYSDDCIMNNFGSDSKTPPVEASLSPEINCIAQSKIVALKSEATPVCYGADHIILGVKDRRKCRRRGSLRGPEKIDTWSTDSIPLGSVRWHLSPCTEDQEIDRLNQCRMVYDHDKSSCRDSEIERRLVPNMVESFLISSPCASLGSELDESLNLWNKMSMWHECDFGFRLGESGEKNVDSDCSWVSDSTLGCLSLSQMRISWHDGTLRSRYVENDDIESADVKERDLWLDCDEPCGFSKTKEGDSIARGTAESICTDEFDCCCILSDGDI